MNPREGREEGEGEDKSIGAKDKLEGGKEEERWVLGCVLLAGEELDILTGCIILLSKFRNHQPSTGLRAPTQWW